MSVAVNSLNLAKAWRKKLQTRQAELKTEFFERTNVSKIVQQNSILVDQLLQDLWLQYDLENSATLIAVGGYGRAELFPYSDVDILILLPDDFDVAINAKVEALISLFWDIGLAVGHSVRTLKECEEEAKKDVTVLTNLLESRYLAGKKKLFDQFNLAVKATLEPRAFFQAKLYEQKQRHARFNETSHNLEPNIKESPGGLRDLQTIIWIAKSLGLGSGWSNLAKQGLISEKEARQIRQHELRLQMLRMRLHYLASRREDRLLFDFQNDLAAELGYVNNKTRRASEQLMHSFYKSAKFVSLMNEILMQLLEEKLGLHQTATVAIDDIFIIRNNLLDIEAPAAIQKNPSLILKSFLLLEQYPVEGMSAHLLRTLLRVKNLLNREFRNNPKNKQLFLQILQQKSGVTKTLRRMNRYGILGAYIPAFGRITSQMQHDLFHVYTVDEHILNVLRNLRRFSHAEFAHEFPLCSKLFTEFDKPYLLYLGALFHDIAKGRGGDHSTLGAVDAKRFCKSHGLQKEDAGLVSWLVDSHLIMSSTAQKSDLSDPNVIEAFAKQMGSERRLTALYLLTVADIRGTSPKVWNAWKAKLLEQLFNSTLKVIRDSGFNISDEILERQNLATTILSHYGIPDRAYLPLWGKLGEPYFLRHEGQEIAWHSRLLITHINTQTPVVRARLSPNGDGIQVMIYTPDKDDLFAKICGFFERMAYSIVEAKIHTTEHGYALDSFLVLDQSTKSVSYRDLLSYIEFELTQKLIGNLPPEPPLDGRLSRQVKLMPIAPRLSLSQDKQSGHCILEIVTGDRPGLLSRIANVFLKNEIHLITAKINTLGNRVEDHFLIHIPPIEMLKEKLEGINNFV